MKTEAIAKLLTGLQERLNVIAKQSDDALTRLGNALERIHRLRNDLNRLELQLQAENRAPASVDDTAEYAPIA